LCFYKPTLLLLVLPLLVVGRCWRLLAGMTITGILLAGLSVAFVGWDVSVEYLDVLLSFRKSTSGGGIEIRTWKYVDLNNWLRLLIGGKSPAQPFVFLVIAIVPFGMLSKHWWRWPQLNVSEQQCVWSATLAWLPLLNLYVGIYDSILVVQSLLLAAGRLTQSDHSKQPLTTSRLGYWVLAIAGSAWFSQSLARGSGVQVYALALIGWGFWTLSQIPVAANSADDRSDAKPGCGPAR